MQVRTSLLSAAAIGLVLGMSACQDQIESQDLAGPEEAGISQTDQSLGALADDPAAYLQASMAETNAALAGAAANYRVVKAEYITSVQSGEVGAEVLAKDVGNKRIGSDYVPNDERREAWSGTAPGLTYAIDQTADAVPLAGGLSGAETDAAIVRSMETWEEQSCSTLDFTRTVTADDIGVVAASIGAPTSPLTYGDIQHAGFTDLNFGGGTLGVTFTFMFCDPCSPTPVFTDVNGDGLDDTAFAEIYYDPFFDDGGFLWPWVDDGINDIDVESIALHEVGHGLSQGHFGTVFIKNNGDLNRSPFAVMNALYAEPLRVLQGTDSGGHCGLWDSWPND